ncbi:MFS general substrate transporter [Ganoderma sinense ZZ0214-1]|uniref:MFS general substrate transporter n=1 Tax=Ganoderma sinense ZZ0214-1 TaxID=1077348 RepID=A0A2G8RZ76_9APHY|nr:MFS general substrate transporter [Ganoderma sinense ZZ0214-1]
MLIGNESLVVADTEKPPAGGPSSQKVLTGIVLAEGVEVVEDPPDGGLRAWLVAFGVAIGMGGMEGIITSWGTLQAYYEEELLQNKSSSEMQVAPSVFVAGHANLRCSAWIGFVQNAIGYAPGLLVGRLFDMGYRRFLVFASSVLFVACTFLTAECTQYWQFLLCQGFGIGITSGGGFFNVGSMVLTHWFKKRLGLALAIAYGGMSMFGWIFPIIIKSLLQHAGFQWTMRILGFISLGLLVATNMTVAGRLPGTRDLGPLFNLSEFKKPVYSFYVAALVVNTLALTNAPTYITFSAVDAGVDVGFSDHLVVIITAVSVLGLLVGGVFADRYNPLDVLICSTLLAAILNFAWPFATGVTPLAVVAVLIGLSTGGVWASLVQPLARMGRLTDVRLRIGMAFTALTVAVAVGSPISGAIFNATYPLVQDCGLLLRFGAGVVGRLDGRREAPPGQV